MDFDFEYLYIERCTFTTDVGHAEVKNRHLVYRYSKALDKIGVWSIKNTDNRTADGLNHLITFDFTDLKPQMNTWSATGSSVQGLDIVRLTYTFHFSGAALHDFLIERRIKTKNVSFVVEFAR